MKVCIIGGSGVIGSKMYQFLSKIGHQVITTYNSQKFLIDDKSTQLDITDLDATISFFKKNESDLVIHSSAITNVDLCETDKELAYSVNVKGTENIVESCKKLNAKLVYISTSYVFDGKKNEYFEEDKPTSSTYYGYIKLKGEEAVINSGLTYLILRTDQPYCWIEKWQHTNSVLRILDNLKTGKIFNEIEDWFNTPTYVPDFVFATSKLIKNNSNGIFHLVGSDFISRYSWSLEVAKIFGLDETKIKLINSEKLELPVKRVNVNLKNFKLQNEIKIKMKGIKDGAISMKNEI